MGQQAGTASGRGRAASPGGRLSVRAMADALGISKSEAHRDSQAGMPMHSVDAAREWRERTHDVARSADGRIDRPQIFGQDSSPNGVGATQQHRIQAPQQLSLASPGDGAGHLAAPGRQQPDPSPLAGGVQAPEDTPEPGDTALYRQERAQREQIRREREQLELDEMKGKLVSVDEASRCAFTAFRALRDAVLNVPARIAPQLAAESDQFAVEQLLDAELTAALTAFRVEGAVRDTDEESDD